MASTLFLLMALVGLTFDFGRIYITHNEAQVFTDAAALAAALKLDGTTAGVDAARNAVAKLPMKWNFGTTAFRNVQIEFSPDGEHWNAAPETTADPVAQLRLVRVSAPSNEVPILFLRAAGGPEKFTVPAHSIAAVDPVRLVE